MIKAGQVCEDAFGVRRTILSRSGIEWSDMWDTSSGPWRTMDIVQWRLVMPAPEDLAVGQRFRHVDGTECEIVDANHESIQFRTVANCGWTDRSNHTLADGWSLVDEPVAPVQNPREMSRRLVDDVIRRLYGEPFAHAIAAALRTFFECSPGLSAATIDAAVDGLRAFESARPAAKVLSPAQKLLCQHTANDAAGFRLNPEVFLAYERARVPPKPLSRCDARRSR